MHPKCKIPNVTSGLSYAPFGSNNAPKLARHKGGSFVVDSKTDGTNTRSQKAEAGGYRNSAGVYICQINQIFNFNFDVIKLNGTNKRSQKAEEGGYRNSTRVYLYLPNM